MAAFATAPIRRSGPDPIPHRRAADPHEYIRARIAAIAGLGRDTPLRNLLAEFGPQVLRIPVSDPGVTENVDTPETYRAALERCRREVPDLSWTGG